MDELNILKAQITVLERRVDALTKSFLDLWADVEILKVQEKEDEMEESTS